MRGIEMTTTALCAALAAGACTDFGGTISPDVVEELADDDASAFVTLEGVGVTDALDPAGASAVIEVRPFRRLGVLWDAPTADALELRTSADRAIWSAWRAIAVTWSEEGAHTGNLDLDDDEAASYVQVRVTDAANPPSFVAVEPIEVIHEPPTGELADTTDADDDLDGDALTTLELSTAIGPFQIQDRKEWGARRPRCADYANPNRATIHHTVSPNHDSKTVKARLRQIQAYHMFSRGYCDIAYNYLVSADGRIWQGRGARRIGGHTFNENTGNVGIAWIGNFTSRSPDAVQLCNNARLLRWLHAKFPALDLTRTDVKGHRQHGGASGATSCPGDALYRRLDDLVRMAKNGCN